MFSPIAPFFSPKGVLREKLKAERRRAHETRPDAARQAAALFMAQIPLADAAMAALYHPLKEELDTAPLVDALAEKGVSLALPYIEKKKAPLGFRRYSAGDQLEAGPHNTRHPAASADQVTPDIIVAPLLGFTRDGGRLGYGGGYYDRTLEKLRERGPVIVVGFAYAAQEVDALPLGSLDQPLDWIVTEREAIRAGGR